MKKETLKFMGNKIREKRKNKKIDLHWLAFNIGVAYGTLANIESGNKKPTIEQLEKIGEVLDCDWHYFFKDEDKFIVDEMTRLKLIEENEVRKMAINSEVQCNIHGAIDLLSKDYSPTTRLFTEKEINDIQELCINTIKIRLKQISDSKKLDIKS